jgi:hypothetical protein
LRRCLQGEHSECLDPYEYLKWQLARTPEDEGQVCAAFPARLFRVTLTRPTAAGYVLRVLFEIGDNTVKIWSISPADRVEIM